MKFSLFSTFAFFKKSKIYNSGFKTYSFLINKVAIREMDILGSKANRQTYSDLRKFKSPQYDIGYVMRLKKGFNTMMFKQAYDVIICDKNGRVLDNINKIRPNFVSKYYEDAYYAYFFSVGTIKYYSIKNDDILRIRRRIL